VVSLLPFCGGAGVKYDRDGFKLSSTLRAGGARASTSGRQAGGGAGGGASLAVHSARTHTTLAGLAALARALAAGSGSL